MITGLFVALLVLTFIFGLTNGFLDGGGLVSTVVTTRAMEPLPALVMVALCEIAGIFLFGHAVVHTLGFHLLTFDPSASPVRLLFVLTGGLIGALSWNLAMWNLSLPSSSSHSLIGGLGGAVIAGYGVAGLYWPLFLTMTLLLGLVPVMALLVSYGLSKLFYWLGEFLTPSVGDLLEGLQIGVLALMALMHGSNDGQKCLGILLLAFLALHPAMAHTGAMPWWTTLLCGGALALGVIAGSRRTLHTMGRRFYRIQNLQSFCAETASLLMVAGSSLAGYPMSTSHVLSTSVVGAGVAVRPGAVRWTLVRDIALAWFITIPASGLVAGLLIKGMEKLSHVVP